jgi:hypothetical protein
MAVCVCHADGLLQEPGKRFLADLRQALQLDSSSVDEHQQTGKATGSAFAFATTYALGQVAKQYYASGRTLTTEQLKGVFASMLEEARGMQGRYSGDIAQKSRQVNVSELLPLVRQQ